MNKLLLCAMVVVPMVASAQPKTADDWYKEGENKYNLGDFPGAVDAFKKGFEAEPNDSKKAAYLFNVAQSYRMAKDCSNAQFFYKRYLALKDNDTKKPLAEAKRKEIEDRIKELDECARQQEAIKNKPPEQDPDKAAADKAAADKAANKTVAANTGDGDGDTDTGVHAGVEVDHPHVLSVRAYGGGAKINAGTVKVPVRPTFGLIGGYPLAVNDKVQLDLGAAFQLTPVAYDSMGVSGTAKFIDVLANVGATYFVAPKIGLRADVGLGVLLLSGVSKSQFTDNQETTGALSMFHVRAGVSADYAVTPNVTITAIPFVFEYSPAHDGLRSDIKNIHAIDFAVGVGYRM